MRSAVFRAESLWRSGLRTRPRLRLFHPEEQPRNDRGLCRKGTAFPHGERPSRAPRNDEGTVASLRRPKLHAVTEARAVVGF